MVRVVSLFSGIGGFERGIQLAGGTAEVVAFAEVNKWAKSVYVNKLATDATVDLRDVTAVSDRQWRAIGRSGVGVLVGGPPCQDLSGAASLGKRERGHGLRGSRSSLFFDFVRALRALRPSHFVMENVASMSRTNRDRITRALKEARAAPVYETVIDARSFTGQSRKRVFWTSFPVDGPPPVPAEDRAARLAERLAPVADVSTLELSAAAKATMERSPGQGRGTRWEMGLHGDTSVGAPCMTAGMYKGGPRNVLIDRRFDPPLLRKFGVDEVERLQGFPEGWTSGQSNTQRYKMLGNAVNAEVSAWIFRQAPRFLFAA